MSDDTNEEHPQGAPEGSANAEKHGLYSDNDKLYQRLEPHEKRLVVNMSQDLFERLDEQAGAYEREAIRNACVDMVKRRRANEYFAEDENFNLNAEHQHSAYSTIMKDTIKELKELGLHLQNPDNDAAEAKKDWFNQFDE